MKNKSVVFFVCMLMITTGVIPVSSTISQNDEKKSSPLEIPNSHIIENIPYVNQGDSYYCPYASITMIFQYYGINTSLFEVLFNSGVGYSIGYKITKPCFGFAGYIMSQGYKDRQFLANIYGLKYSYWKCDDKSLSEDSKWQLYWTCIKENISKDIPVATWVWMDELPYYKNQSIDHEILLVGYNETNNSVCVHDSYVNFYNASISGTYIYIPIDCIKKSQNFLFDKYLFEIFEKTANSPLSKKEAFELAHSRNIQRMKGDANVYDKDFIKTELGIHIFGVYALKFIQHSYKMRNILLRNLMGKITGIDKIRLLANYSWWNYYEKHNMSQYLIENADLYANAKYEADMLENESNNWFFLYYKNIELSSIPIFRIPAQLSVVKEIRNTLDVIISIEKDIITNHLINKVRANGNTQYVGGSGPGNYTKIQDAIDHSSDRDIVFVYDDSSPYYENLIIDKQISLIGEDKETTIIDGTRSDSVIYILKDNVSIASFTVQNGSRDDYRRAGIEIYSCNNRIIGNIITNNLNGIHSLFAGVLNNEGNNTFIDNIVIANDLDAFCFHNSHNLIQHNLIENNEGGIELWINSIGNTIEKNNFINNTYNAILCYSSFNRWKNNYWDDWIGLKNPLMKLCPKVIVKKIILYNKIRFIPWFNFDWHPAQEPYTIT